MTPRNGITHQIAEEKYRDDNNLKFNLIEIDDSSKLISYLRLSNPMWMSDIRQQAEDTEWVRRWYFRGQGDAEWDLIPSAWRKSKPEDRSNVIEIGRDSYSYLTSQTQNAIDYLLTSKGATLSEDRWDAISYATKQIAIELQIVNEFIQFADSVGHFVPDSALPLVNREFIFGLVSDLVNNTQETFNPKIWFDKAVLLAQHHGIPTRLLDWTKHPLTAAYFAASDAIAHQPKSGFFAIYALHKLHLNHRNVYDDTGKGSQNVYLTAQQGVLTADIYAEKFYFTHLRYPDLMSSLFNFGEYPHNPYRPYKFMVPLDLAHDLIRQLFLARVTRAHLMPNLDNVAQTIKDKWHFVLTPPSTNDLELKTIKKDVLNDED